MKKGILLGIIFVFSYASAFAETTIKAEVDKSDITTDEALTYKVIVTSTEKDLPEIQPPKFDGFNLIYQAKSTTFSFVKSNIKTILVYAFILAPTDIGKFKIEPSSIKVKGQEYSTAAFEIEVKQGKAPLKPQPKKKSVPESQEPQYVL
jgi:hypothetical protein